MNEATEATSQEGSDHQPEYQKVDYFIHEPGKDTPTKEKTEELVVKPDPTAREKLIKEKYDFDPQIGLKERGVRFDGPEGPAWAIEALIPVSDAIRKEIKGYHSLGSNIIIPERIKTIRFVDLAPQESVYPARLRTVKTHWMTKSRRMARGYLDRLREYSKPDKLSEFMAFLRSITMGGDTPEEKKGKVFSDMFDNIFSKEKQAQEHFNKILAQSKGTELLIVHGHGGFDPHVMGEKYPDEVVRNGYITQRRGNRVATEEILEHYDHPELFSAIVLVACNLEKAKIKAKQTPIVYVEGSSSQGANPFLFEIGPGNKPILNTPDSKY